MPPRPSIAELVAADRLESIAADAREARDLLAHAENHLQSADRIAQSDPAGAYQLLYDAARKAVAADMTAAGYRVKSDRPGAHAAIVLYAEEALAGSADERALRRFDQMRRLRNRSEYVGLTVSPAQLSSDLRHAEAIVAAVRARVGP
jgi:hypothetical protein